MSHNINCYRFFKTSYRIDWTTLGASSSTGQNLVHSSGTSWTNTGSSITISTSGKYLFLGSSGLSSSTGDWKHGLLRIYNTSTSQQIGTVADMYGLKQGDITGLVSLNAFGIAAVSAGNIVKLQFRTTSGVISTDAENGSYPLLICIRIGSANA